MLHVRTDGSKPEEEWDVFISHASEDKDAIATPLAEALRAKGLRVWYDDFALKMGDSLRQSIDRGLARSRFGVVILSGYFFQKHWPQQELNGLATREDSGKVNTPSVARCWLCRSAKLFADVGRPKGSPLEGWPGACRRYDPRSSRQLGERLRRAYHFLSVHKALDDLRRRHLKSVRGAHPLKTAKILSSESSFFLSGEVQENVSLFSDDDWQFQCGEQAGAVVAGVPAEHTEDGVQHFAGHGDECLQFGFAA